MINKVSQNFYRLIPFSRIIRKLMFGLDNYTIEEILGK